MKKVITLYKGQLRPKNIEVAKLLLDAGAAVNVSPLLKKKIKDTPLGVAASCGNFELVKLLIEKGADVNALNHFSGSTLRIAIVEGYFEIAKLLLKHGADVNQLYYEKNILCTAVEDTDNSDIINTLIKYGADVNSRRGLQDNSIPFKFSPLNIAVNYKKVLGNHYTIGIRC